MKRVRLSVCQVCGAAIVQDRRWWPWARWRHTIGPRNHKPTRRINYERPMAYEYPHGYEEVQQ